MARSIPLLVLVALLAALAHAEEKAREPADVMRALLLRRADVLVDASQARLGVLEADLREASSRWEMGVADDATVVVAREAVLEARMALARAKLEREEVRLTGQPPSDDPAAPMAGDRDLVHERLQLDHEESHLRLRALRTRLKLLEGRRAAAGIGEQELAATRLDVEIEKRRLESVENRIALRTSFREGKITAAAIRLAAARDQARLALDLATLRRDEGSRVLDRARELRRSGVIGTGDLRAAELDLHAAETDVRLAEIDLELLELTARTAR
jgi:hypothetical protein